MEVYRTWSLSDNWRNSKKTVGLFMPLLVIRKAEKETVSIFIHPDIIDQVRKQLIPAFRPDLPSEVGDNKGIIQLMQMCWDDDPSTRPTCSEIKSKLKSLGRRKWVLTFHVYGNFIDPIHNWLPIKNYLVCILISPTKLVSLKVKIFWIIISKTEAS